MRVDWNNWGNIKGIEWGIALPFFDDKLIDVDLVGSPLTKTEYESVTIPAMIRYEKKSVSTPSLNGVSDHLIDSDGNPISPIDIPIYEHIPNRSLQLFYIPSQDIFRKKGDYLLSYKINIVTLLTIATSAFTNNV